MFPHKSAMTSFERFISDNITITATPTLVSELIADMLAANGIDTGTILGFQLWEKLADGTDRLAIHWGHSATEMNIFVGDGVRASICRNPAKTYVERHGGADVNAVIVIALAS